MCLAVVRMGVRGLGKLYRLISIWLLEITRTVFLVLLSLNSLSPARMEHLRLCELVNLCELWLTRCIPDIELFITRDDLIGDKKTIKLA